MSAHIPHSAEPDAHLGAILADRYRIDRLLDTGAMGRVYVGEHVLMRKRVAIKVLHRELSMVPEFVQRFEREAMAAANIPSEHVVAATDFGKLPDGAVFLVLEFVAGKSLRDEIDAGPMPAERAMRIARQIAEALKSAHDLGIVHRDLKPENVMLVNKAGDPDFVKVLDFGIAKVPIGEAQQGAPSSSRPITKAGMVFGTPEYMPPEQALGQEVDQRADVYSLGVILYEMIAGVRPFAGDSQVGVLGQQLASPAPPISSRAPSLDVHRGVEKFVLSLLEREASKRPQSAQAVLEALDRLLGNPSGRTTRLLTLKEGTVQALADPPPLGTFDGSYRPADSDLAPRQSFGPVGRIVDAHRHRLPAFMRGAPAPVLLAAPAAVVSLALGIGLVSALSPDAQPSVAARHDAVAPSSAESAPATASPASVPPAKALADAAALSEAAKSGVAALRTLQEQFPRDPQIAIALGGAHLKQGEFSEAVQAISQAIELDDTLTRDKQVASALWVLSQNKKSSAAAFDLLKGKMGERGREILKDLATTKGVRESIRAEARKVLAQG